LSIVCIAYSADEWSLTPSGWRPTACIHGPISLDHAVINGETFSYLKEISSGQMIRIIPPCKYPAADTKPLPNGWAAYAWAVHAIGELTSYNGTWPVPPTPKDESTQTLFLFTGFQNAFGTPANVTNIIQPVLQWGSSAAGGGKYWAMASWYVDSNGNAFFSTLTETAAAHNIQGNMHVTSKTNWVIETMDVTTSKKTTLNIATNTSEPYTFVTLEVYTISSCTEYPTGSDIFSNLVFSPSFTPKWTPVATPGCEESVKVVSPSSIQINF